MKGQGGCLGSPQNKWCQINDLMKQDIIAILAVQETHIRGQDI